MKHLLFYPLMMLMFCYCSCTGQTEDLNPDWPRFRGPGNDGVWNISLDLDRFDSSSIEKVWETSIGAGFCGPTISNGRVYVMDYIAEPEPAERVCCFDARSGESLWNHDYPCTYFNVGYPTGPRASVLIHEGRAYSFGTMGNLYCLDAATGRVFWHHDAVKEYNSRIPVWGLATSPVVENDLVIVQMGGRPDACLVAFDRITGEEVWRALDEKASYSAPVIINQAGQRVLVCWTGGSVSGLNPENGRLHWQIPFTPRRAIMNISSPVYEPPYLFLSGFFDGSMLIRLDQNELQAELLWYRYGENERNTDALHCCISTPVLEGDYIYGLDSYGEMRCLELLTGDRVWEDNSLVPRERWANVHFIRQGKKIWAFNELGDLILCSFTPEGVTEYGRVNLIEPVPLSPLPRNGVCWAHPGFAGYRVYVRNDAKLACYRIFDSDRSGR